MNRRAHKRALAIGCLVLAIPAAINLPRIRIPPVINITDRLSDSALEKQLLEQTRFVSEQYPVVSHVYGRNTYGRKIGHEERIALISYTLANNDRITLRFSRRFDVFGNSHYDKLSTADYTKNYPEPLPVGDLLLADIQKHYTASMSGLGQ